MQRRQSPLFFALAAAVLLSLSATAAAAFTPWHAVYKAFKDPRSYMVQAKDARLVLALRRNLLLDDPSSVVDVSVVCLMGRVFLIGQADSARQREEYVQKARATSGVASVNAYLPTKAELVPGDASASKVRLSLFGDNSAAPATLTVKALGGAVVLAGCVASAQDREAVERAVGGVEGVATVVNFLLTPEAGEGKALPGVVPSGRRGPLRRLLGD